MKAIELNPVFFSYHLELGRFYTDQGRFKEAKEELMTAYELYPIEAQVKEYLREYHLILARKFFEEKNDKEAFKALLLARMWEPGYFIYHAREREEIIDDVSNAFWDHGKRKMTYAAQVQSDYYDFQEQGFPHEKIPITAKVYFKEHPQKVILYGQYAKPDRFKRIEGTPQYIIYEAKIESFPENIYLDSFRIETDPPATIEKIELINEGF